MRFLLALAAVAALGFPAAGAAPPKANARTIAIGAGDNMKFSVTEIRAKRGERLRLVLTSSGTMPKAVMAHNVVVLARGVDVTAFANASAMARDNAYIAPAFAGQVIAATPLAGNGETVEVTFQVPNAPGRYEYICSFPGHFLAGMRGVLIVS